MASHFKTIATAALLATLIPSATRVTAATGSFAPTQISGLKAWFDPSVAAGVSQHSGAVESLNDLSGNENSVSQSGATLRPTFTASGIDGLGSVTFAGKSFLVGGSNSFSKNVFNESTVFVVSNQSDATQSSSVAWTGAFLDNPRWNLRLSENGSTTFDFNDFGAGRLSPHDVPNGPAVWTAGGSVSHKAQFVRKDGNTLSTGTTSGKAAQGDYPLAIGATYGLHSQRYFYSGQLGEMLFFDRALTAAETMQIEGYLACKWGLQNRLPANHPYRNACPQGGSHPSLPLPVPAAGALQDPQQLRSKNGSLTFDVVASQASNGYPRLVYNGSTVAPTLRLLPGDTLFVNLTNALPKPPSGAGYLNDTNLHYHGLHVSPNAPGDDSIDMLAMPGQTLHYKIAIPKTHPSGLYWYHSHAHGEAERQNLAGMSGALIVDGIAKDVPEVANMPERILIARDTIRAGQKLPAADAPQVDAMLWAMQHAARSGVATAGMSAMPGMTMGALARGSTTQRTRNPFVEVNPNYRRFVRPAASSHCLAGKAEQPSRDWTLNGKSRPSIGIRPGERQFWRLVNAGSDTYLDFAIDRASIAIVALDGVPLPSVGNAPLTVGHYLVPPASRIEFIVTGPSAGSPAYLRTNCFDAGPTGLAMPGTTLASIDATSSLSDAVHSGERSATSLGLAGTTARRMNASFGSFIKTHAIARTQTLTYSSQDQINGQTYDPAGPPQFYAQSGTLEQWQIVNVSSQVHTFHIHQTHFLVKSIVGGTTGEQQNVGQVIDEINVPAATATGPGSVTLVMDFTDPSIIGTFLLHCHILSHEDMGMMSKIRVGTAPPLTTNAPAQGLTFSSPTAATQSFTVAGGQTPYSLSGCANVANAAVTGSKVTVTPTGAGGCVLVVADASGLTANVSITVKGKASPITVSPNALAFTSPSAPSANASIAGGTKPYGVTGCATVATASIADATLSVRPKAVGTCTLTVTDAASDSQVVSISVNAPNAGSATDNLTFHQNNARQGWNQAETILTTSNVTASAFGKLAFLSGSGYGKVYAQPLYASNETIGGVVHGLVIVSTATDRVYAYDSKTLATVWTRTFTNAAAKITQQSWADIQCKDVNPDIGIVGTPVIDRALDRMYLVVPTKENGAFHMRLHALSLQSGADAVAPVEVSASVLLAGGNGTATTSAEHNFNRTALLEANGNIYVGLGSHCDAAAKTTHGWMLAYKASSLAPVGSVIDLTNGQAATFLGVPWMAGYGPAADAAGNVYFATGNGPWDGVNAFSMSDIKVPGDLNIGNGSFFTPYGYAALSNADQDLGSGGVVLLPDGLSAKFPHLLVQGGKNRQKYVLNRDKLGGLQQGDAGAVWQANFGGAFGGPAFFQDSSGKAYIVDGNGILGTYVFNAASASFTLAKSAAIPGNCLECRDGGSQPIVSSNGTASGTTIVWALQSPGDDGGNVSLFAFDASTMQTLYSGVAGGWYPGSGLSTIGGAFISPLVADGKVYVPIDGGVAVFGLK